VFIFFCDRFNGFHWLCVKNLCTKHCCKNLNKQSSGVHLIHFTLIPMGKVVSVYEHFGLRTTFRNALSSWTEVWLYLVEFFTEWEMFKTKVVQKIKTDVVWSKCFLRKSCRLWDKVEKYSKAGQATGDTRAHVFWMLDKKGYKHTMRKCNSFQGNIDYWKAPQCNVIRTSPVLLLQEKIYNLWPSWWHSFIDLRNSSSPPFLLLGSISPVRDIVV